MQAELVELKRKIEQTSAEKEALLKDTVRLDENLAKVNNEINKCKAQLTEYKDVRATTKKENNCNSISDLNLQSSQAGNSRPLGEPETAKFENETTSIVRFTFIYIKVCMYELFYCTW